MLGSIKTFFQQHIRENAPQAHGTLDRLHIATTALLLEVSAADFHASEDELQVTAQALANTYSLAESDVNELIQLTREELKDTVSLHQFTSAIKDNLSYKERVSIVGMLWEIAYADGVLDKHEDHLIRRISDLIYVSHSDFIKSKLTAKKGGGTT